MAKIEIDDSLVRRLASLLDETGLTEIEYEVDDERIRVVRGGQSVTTVAAPVPAVAPVSASRDSDGERSEVSVPANAVTSPMVGTAYLSPEPGAAPFVKVGDRVAKGQTLMIIEAMKVMNALPSVAAGVVTQIMIEDGQPVEYGEPLMVIE